MAVAVTLDVPGGTEQQYEQFIARVSPEGKHPEGLLVHIAGPNKNGWRVLNVGASQEKLEAFARELLLPAIRLVGGATPEFTFFPVHGLIWDRTNCSRPRCRPADGETHRGRHDRISFTLEGAAISRQLDLDVLAPMGEGETTWPATSLSLINGERDAVLLTAEDATPWTAAGDVFAQAQGASS